MTISCEYVEEMRAQWLPGAMYPSEIAWLIQQLTTHAVEVIIECGRQDGVSTKCLGELLAPGGTTIFSIDFDEDRDRLEKIKKLLSGMNVVCVSGDIHQEVPRLLHQNQGHRIAIIQDGPKGWEGLSTLVAGAFADDVVLIAQHNLQRGHHSRAYFHLLACNPPFLEYDIHATLAQELRNREIQDAVFRKSNRPIDHSSLGICSLSPPLRPVVVENIYKLDKLMGPWSAVRTAKKWLQGDYAHVAKLRRKQRLSWYRFKAQ